MFFFVDLKIQRVFHRASLGKDEGKKGGEGGTGRKEGRRYGQHSN